MAVNTKPVMMLLSVLLLLLLSFHQSAAARGLKFGSSRESSVVRSMETTATVAVPRTTQKLVFVMLPRGHAPPSGPSDGINGNKN
ncbi:hypothetical protein BHE74_00056472 [Ensete ventricosum]|nr:hypothetical protein BHE74_00056472 [Ensete ventricosum]